MTVTENINTLQPVYIWCHDIGVTERLVELLTLPHVVIIGTFKNFVRDGVQNIFKDNRTIRSICYLLPRVRHVGDYWMSICTSLVSVDFIGLDSVVIEQFNDS
jgi:hypothetical protein